MIWDDASGDAGVNRRPCPNLMLFLNSILFQKVDEIEYGERGRYGLGTVKRMRDGHYGPTDRPYRMITSYLFDYDTGMPYGFTQQPVIIRLLWILKIKK